MRILAHPADAEGADRGDVGDREGDAGDEFAPGQFAVEPFHPLLGVPPAEFAVVLHLLDPTLPIGVRVAEASRHVEHDLGLHPPVPHLDVGLVAGIGAKQRRLWLTLLEIAADGDRLGEARTVVELQHRHAGQRVLGDELGGEVALGGEVDLRLLDLDALLVQKDVDAAGVGGDGGRPEFHLFVHSLGFGRRPGKSAPRGPEITPKPTPVARVSLYRVRAIADDEDTARNFRFPAILGEGGGRVNAIDNLGGRP